MNVGEYLISKSPLNSGTALAHLLAMQTGSVVGKTIFAAQMTVCVEEPQVTLIQRPSEHNVATTQAETTTTQQDKPSRVYAQTRPARVDVATRSASMHVVQKPTTSVSVQLLPHNLTSRRKRIIQST